SAGFNPDQQPVPQPLAQSFSGAVECPGGAVKVDGLASAASGIACVSVILRPRLRPRDKAHVFFGPLLSLRHPVISVSQSGLDHHQSARACSHGLSLNLVDCLLALLVEPVTDGFYATDAEVIEVGAAAPGAVQVSEAVGLPAKPGE